MLRHIVAFVLTTALITAAIAQETPSPTERAFRQYAEGLLIREVYTTRDRVTVDIWDLMVGPGKSSAPATLPGAAILEVRSGAGTLEQTGKRDALRLGTVLSLPPQTEFRLSNASRTQALVLRAVIVKPTP